MISEQILREIINNPNLTQKDLVLLCLAADDASPKTLASLKDVAKRVGLRNAGKLSYSSRLSELNGKVSRIGNQWHLLIDGKNRVADLLQNFSPHIAKPVVVSSLRDQLKKISNAQTQAFVLEAITCFEHSLFRAAVVLSWIGAIHTLYTHVVIHRLNDFNHEATRRNIKWKPAKNEDDLALMKESDFLHVLENLSIIGKSVKQELEACLTRRNGCGHPNSMKLAENTVAHHIEVLLLNVFDKFP